MEEEVFASLGMLLGFMLFMGLLLKAVRGNAHLSTVVLTGWEVDSERLHIEIEGRAPGLVAWILKAVGLGSTTTFRINPQELRLNARNLQGESLILMPSSSITCVRARYRRPVWAILSLIWVLFLSTLPLMFMFMVGSEFGNNGLPPRPDAFMGTFTATLMLDGFIAVFFLLIYVLGKKLVIEVDTSEGKGPTLGIGFKPSILDGVSMSMEQLTEVAELINGRIAKQNDAS